MKIRHFLVAATIFSTSTAIQAGEYLGFDLGEDTRANIVEQLDEAGARYDANYSYKGSGVLQAIQLHAAPQLARHGQLVEGWLEFDRDNRLYRVTVTYADAGETFTVFKDALDTKYGNPVLKGFGFTQTYTYRDGSTEIRLTRNTFGFGSEQRTKLTYTHSPYATAVQATRQAIDQQIKELNAASVADDL